MGDKVEPRTVAALYVAFGGAYYGVPGVEPWGLPERDARLYPGPYPVVAHPPCATYCAMAWRSKAKWDGGCFAAALAAVRRWGGILEHPARTTAWKIYGIPSPPSSGGWVPDGLGGWTCCVSQGHYGHRASKATWLYLFGVPSPPPLIWGRYRGPAVPVCDLSHRERAATPIPFRDLLLSLARMAFPDRADTGEAGRTAEGG